MWIKPAVAGAAVVIGLALVVGAEGASTPGGTSSTVEVERPGRDHDDGRKHGHDKHEKAEKAQKAQKAQKPDRPGRAEKPDRPGRRSRAEDAPTGNGPPPHVTNRPGHPRHGEACVRPARYEGGPLEACPWTRVEGRVVPAEPRPYSETEE